MSDRHISTLRAAEYLAEVKERANKATEGPWDHYGDLAYEVFVSTDLDYGREEARQVAVMGEDGTLADSEFIAQARTDVPRMVAALQAVLVRHAPYRNDDGEVLCVTCKMPAPCRTVRAIEAALDPEGDKP